MIRKLKVLGPALVAVLAMGAVGASGASATNFTSFSGAKITAEDTGSIKFTITGQTVTCKKAVFTGTAPAASFTELAVNAEYSECTTGFAEATITGFGKPGEAEKCYFVFYSTGLVDLLCSTGAEVTINAGPCVVHIPARTSLGSLTYTNNSSHVDIGINLTKIVATHTDGFLCPFGSNGLGAEAVLETPAASPMTAVPSVGTFSRD